MNRNFTKIALVIMCLFSLFNGLQAQNRAFFNPNNNGNDAWLEAPIEPALTNLTTGDFTIEAWINPLTLNNGPHSHTIVSTEHNDNKGYIVRFGLNGGSPEVQFLAGNGSNQFSVVAANVTLPTNNWTHVAVVNSNNTITIYLNGISSASGTIANMNTFPTVARQMRINEAYFTGRQLQGNLDEVRVWSSAKTQAQIQANMAGELCVKQSDGNTVPNLIVYYKFNEASGNSYVDASGNGYTATKQGGTTQGWPTVTISNTQVPTFTTREDFDLIDWQVGGYANGDFLCNGDTIAFHGLGTFDTGAITYSWMPTTGLSQPDSIWTSLYPTSSTNYTVTATKGTNGCARVFYDSVTVTTPPIPTYTLYGSNSICRGDTVGLKVSSTSTDPTRIYFVVDSTLVNSAIQYNGTTINDTLALIPQVTTKYYISTRVTLASGHCFSPKDSFVITVNDMDSMLTNPPAACAGDSVQLYASDAAATSYSWAPSTGLSNPNINNPKASPTTLTTYTVTAVTGTCSIKRTVTVNVSALPTLNVTGSSVICPNVNGGAATLTITPVATSTVTSANTLTLNALGNASSYPENITVSGLSQELKLKEVRFNLGNIVGSSMDLAKFDIWIEAPNGTKSMLISDLNYAYPSSFANVEVRDNYSTPPLGFNLFNSSLIQTNPVNFAPSTGEPTGLPNSLAALTGDINGTWKLFAKNDASGDNFQMTDIKLMFEPSNTSVQWIHDASMAATFNSSNNTYTGIDTPATLPQNYIAQITTADGCIATDTFTVDSFGTVPHILYVGTTKPQNCAGDSVEIIVVATPATTEIVGAYNLLPLVTRTAAVINDTFRFKVLTSTCCPTYVQDIRPRSAGGCIDTITTVNVTLGLPFANPITTVTGSCPSDLNTYVIKPADSTLFFGFSNPLTTSYPIAQGVGLEVGLPVANGTFKTVWYPFDTARAYPVKVYLRSTAAPGFGIIDSAILSGVTVGKNYFTFSQPHTRINNNPSFSVQIGSAAGPISLNAKQLFSAPNYFFYNLGTTTSNSTAGINKGIQYGYILEPDTIAPSNFTYSWTPSAGLTNATIHNPSASPTAVTVFTVSVSNGCVKTATVSLTTPCGGSNIADTACTSFTWALNATTYTTSGTYYSPIANSTYFDTLVLTIIAPTTNTITDTACGTYTFGGNTLSTSGTYLDTMVNSTGCDSIITLNLFIKQPSATTIVDTACGSYTYNGQLLTASGTYTNALVNSIGCDSVVTLNLYIKPLGVISTITTTEDTICIGNTATLSVTLPTAGSMVSMVSTFAGSGTAGNTNGNGTAALFSFPYGVATDAAGNVYVADNSNNVIRKISPFGAVTTFAGSGNIGSADGIGIAAEFSTPYSVATDASGNVYVTDGQNRKIRKITPSGVVTTLAGGTYGTADGTGSAAQFHTPFGIATDSSGNIYVSDHGNNNIRKITQSGVVTTLAGSISGYLGNTDGTGTAALFWGPKGLVTDAAGNVYVADQSNHRIRKITPAGVVTTFAGSSYGNLNGIGTAAQFSGPNDLDIDAAGNLYVTDEYNNIIRKITPSGVVTTIAGTGVVGSTNGIASVATFQNPAGIALDAQGNLFIADPFNQLIRKIGIPMAAPTQTVAWSPVSSLTAPTDSTSVVATPTATTVYTVTATTSLGCTATSTVEVVINQYTVNPPLYDTACTTYTWAKNNQTYTTAGAYVDSSNCSVDSLYLYFATTPASIAITNPISVVCPGNSGTITPVGAATYTITPSSSANTSTASGAGAEFIITPTVATVYTITGTTNKGCIGSTTIAIGVGPGKGLSLTNPVVLPAIPCGSAFISDTSSNNPAVNCGVSSSNTYNNSPETYYQFTLANTAIVHIAMVDYNNANYFQPYLSLLDNTFTEIASDENGTPNIYNSNTNLKGSSTITTTLNAGTYYISAEGYDMDMGNFILYLNQSETTGGIKTVDSICGTYNVSTPYTWAANPSVTVDLLGQFSGTKTYTYYYARTSGTCAVTDTLEVKKKNGIISATATVSNATICSGDSTQLTATASVSNGFSRPLTFSWANASTISTPTTAGTFAAITFAKPLANTTYTVTITNKQGCTTTRTVAVSMSPNQAVLSQATANNATSVSGSGTDALVQPDGTIANYADANCNLIATVDDGAGGNVLGSTAAEVIVDASVTTYNTQPYTRRHFKIEPTNQGAATVTLYQTQNDFDDYNTYATANGWPLLPTGPTDAAGMANLRITQVHNAGILGTNNAEVKTPTLTWNATTNYWSATFPVDSFSTFYFHTLNPGNGPLSIQLLSFVGKIDGSKDVLSWVTASENNNAYFTIEHSTDAMSFTKMGTVNTKAVNGNSTSNLHYEFVNAQPKAGRNYYRLLQTDALGNTTVNSKVVNLNRSIDGTIVQLYPNPVSSLLNVSINSTKSGTATIKVMDATGRLVKQIEAYAEAGINNYQIDLTELPAGLYNVQVSVGKLTIYTGLVTKQ